MNYLYLGLYIRPLRGLEVQLEVVSKSPDPSSSVSPRDQDTRSLLLVFCNPNHELLAWTINLEPFYTCSIYIPYTN